MRNSYATVPHGRTSYPCLKVQFVKANGEISLRDYTEDVVSLIPFCLSMKLKDIYGLKRRSLTFVWKTIDAADVTDVYKEDLIKHLRGTNQQFAFVRYPQELPTTFVVASSS
ncbi:HECT domain-containing protein [Forsythia ovata]|uniref:HECT domain-containing protein n=1 Tax=Forsythia ovata TaxID=205694 RepID=A0ABD1RK41_9LAMI